MATVVLSALARQDLLDARHYIESELQNPAAARRIVAKIFESMQLLKQFPAAGTPLQLSGLDTGYRTITSGNYRVFYRCEQDTVYVVRILYARRDFMHILFGSADTTDET